MIPGKVTGKPRPRFRTNGKPYTPASGARYERHIARCYRTAGLPLIEGPVKVSIEIHRKLPKSRPKRVDSEPDTFKPDIDNVAKAFLDALNGVAYEDDRYVTSIEVRKAHRERIAEEYVIVTIEEDI